jgi:3-oxoacyl-[acyl-carrier protein] reductase
MKKLANKVALVTGGSRGIGAGIAKRLALEGATVVITYAQAGDKAQAVVNDIQKAGGRALALQANNNSPAEVQAAVEKAAATYGQIDILVNNAGIALLKPIGEYSVEEYDETMAVNVRAVFVACNTAVSHMKAGGRIITIGSNMADRVNPPNFTLYAMSKSALIGLTKGMARDLGPKGITVNLVQPGPVDTDMNPASGPHAAAQLEKMAVSEYGKPEDIAGLVAYLAGEESRYITGTALTIDGGYNI